MKSVVVNILCTFLGILIGYVAEPIRDRIHQWWVAPSEEFALPLAAKYEDLKALADFRYILVRFGSDEEIKRLTSKQSEDAGLQLIYEEVELAKAADGQTTELIFRMPVHKVLGTQFKIFALQIGSTDPEKLPNMLNACCADQVTITSQRGREVWLLLNPEKFPALSPRLRIVETTDNKILNNWMMAPRFTERRSHP
jgi:hypothetical protein